MDFNLTPCNNADSLRGVVCESQLRFEDIVGDSVIIEKTVSLAKRFAQTSENILLTGESGTGKELFAQAIHNQYRPDGPFMAFNCASMPRELIQSELFGYEGGSFTGADKSGKLGKIELADGGTLFLDEIGDMSLELQAILLRTIEDKQVIRIGGYTYKKVDFRVVAATNKNLYEMTKKNRFREDLYYRLSVLAINIPPLRNRDKDMDILTRHFIKTYCLKKMMEIPLLSPVVEGIFRQYDWPGNVRQLQNTIIYALNTMQNGIINIDNLPEHILKDMNRILKTSLPKESKTSPDYYTLKDWEMIAIRNALMLANNRVEIAAGMLGVGKSTLYRKIREYQIACN